MEACVDSGLYSFYTLCRPTEPEKGDAIGLIAAVEVCRFTAICILMNSPVRQLAYPQSQM